MLCRFVLEDVFRNLPLSSRVVFTRPLDCISPPLPLYGTFYVLYVRTIPCLRSRVRTINRALLKCILPRMKTEAELLFSVSQSNSPVLTVLQANPVPARGAPRMSPPSSASSPTAAPSSSSSPPPSSPPRSTPRRDAWTSPTPTPPSHWRGRSCAPARVSKATTLEKWGSSPSAAAAPRSSTQTQRVVSGPKRPSRTRGEHSFPSSKVENDTAIVTSLAFHFNSFSAVRRSF